MSDPGNEAQVNRINHSHYSKTTAMAFIVLYYSAEKIFISAPPRSTHEDNRNVKNNFVPLYGRSFTFVLHSA